MSECVKLLEEWMPSVSVDSVHNFKCSEMIGQYVLQLQTAASPSEMVAASDCRPEERERACTKTS